MFSFNMVSAWVLNFLSKPQPGIFYRGPPPPPTLKKTLKQVPSGRKNLDNSNMLHIFDKNTNTDFRTALKQIIILTLFERFNRTKMSQN